MAATAYTFVVSSAFPNAKVDVDRLTQEIEESAISVALDHIGVTSGSCVITFKDELSAPEQTQLSSLVANHSGEPLANGVQIVELASPSTSEGRPVFQPSSFPGGVYLYIPGAGDSRTLGRGKGQTFGLESDVAGDSSIEFQFNDWVYASGGGLVYEGGRFGDYADFMFVAPATPVVPNAGGTGNVRLVPPQAGYPSILIVPSPGTGTHDADLSQACPVPAIDPNDNGIGYWDWSEPSTGLGTVSYSPTPGAARWFLFAVEMPLVKFVNRMPLLGDKALDFNVPPIKSKKMLPQWKGRVTLHNIGHTGLKAAFWLYTARAVTT
jgi:hypothetical protein